jgi:hypothetical protein
LNLLRIDDSHPIEHSPAIAFGNTHVQIPHQRLPYPSGNTARESASRHELRLTNSYIGTFVFPSTFA